jgi:hypothetical protein
VHSKRIERPFVLPDSHWSDYANYFKAATAIGTPASMSFIWKPLHADAINKTAWNALKTLTVPESRGAGVTPEMPENAPLGQNLK